MDWTKIKTKYFLHTDFTIEQHGALARILCLTAHLERTPSRKEMLHQMHYKQLMSLQSKLKERPIEGQESSNDGSIELQYIVNKVLEDVEGIEHKKAVSRGTSKRYRKTMELKAATGDTSLDTTEKRREEKKREEKKKLTSRVTFTPPTLQDVKAYCLERRNGVNPDKWHSHYTSNGWMVGRNKMKNWKAAIHTWEQSPGSEPKKRVYAQVNTEKPDPKEQEKVAELVRTTANILRGNT